MSGGHFDYKHHHIFDISQSIKAAISKNEELYSKETISRFEEAIVLLNKAYVLTHEIDLLLEGDNGEDSFHRNIKDKLRELGYE